jgi:taurine dioxygenase
MSLGANKHVRVLRQVIGRVIATTVGSHVTWDPHVSVADSEHGGKVNVWHTDTTFALRPPKASILRVVTLPAWAGITLWANTAAAYRQLPKSLRQLADGLWARHDDVIDDTNLSPELVGILPDGGTTRREIRLAPTPFQTDHPVVQVHPETGERATSRGARAKNTGCEQRRVQNPFSAVSGSNYPA